MPQRAIATAFASLFRGIFDGCRLVFSVFFDRLKFFSTLLSEKFPIPLTFVKNIVYLHSLTTARSNIALRPDGKSGVLFKGKAAAEK